MDTPIIDQLTATQEKQIQAIRDTAQAYTDLNAIMDALKEAGNKFSAVVTNYPILINAAIENEKNRLETIKRFHEMAALKEQADKELQDFLNQIPEDSQNEFLEMLEAQKEKLENAGA